MDSQIERLVKERDLILHTSSQLTEKVEQLTQQSKEDQRRLTHLEDLRVARDREFSVLETQHRETSRELEQLKADRELLQEKLTHLERQLTTHAAENVQLQTQHASALFKLKDELQRVTQAKTQLKLQEHTLKSQSQAELQKLTEYIRAQKADAQTLADRCEQQRNELARTQAKVAQLTEELRTAHADKNYLQGVRDSLEGSLHVQQAEWERKWRDKEEQHASELRVANRVFEMTSGTQPEDGLKHLIEKLEETQTKYLEATNKASHLEKRLKTYLEEYDNKAPVLVQQKNAHEELVMAFSRATCQLNEQQQLFSELQAELRTTKAAAAQQTQELQASELAVGRLEAQVKALFLENHKLKHKLDVPEDTLVFKNVEDLHRKYFDLQSELNAFKDAKAQEAQALKAEHVADVAALKSQLKFVEDKYADLGEQFRKAVHEKHPLKKLQALEAFYAEQTRQYQGLVAERDEYATNAHTLHRRCEDLRHELDQARTKISTLQMECKQLKETCQADRKGLDTTKERLAKCETKVSQREAENSRLSTLLTQAREGHTQLTSQFSQLLAAYSQLVEQLNTLDKQMVEMQQRHSVESEHLIKSKSLCYEQLAKLKHEHANAKKEWAEEVAMLNSQIENYKFLSKSSSMTATDTEMQRLRQECSEEQERNRALVLKLRELAQYESHRDRAEMLRADLREKSLECEDYKKLAETYKLATEALKKDIQAIRTTHVQLEERVLRDRQVFGQSHQQFAGLSAQNEALAQEKTQLEAILHAVQAEKDALRAQMERAPQEPEDAKRLKERNQQLQERIQQLRERVKQLQEEARLSKEQLDSHKQEADARLQLAHEQHRAELVSQTSNLEKRVESLKRQGEMLRDTLRAGKAKNPEVLSQLVSLVHKALTQ